MCCSTEKNRRTEVAERRVMTEVVQEEKLLCGFQG
jgi:hypothetical protein